MEKAGEFARREETEGVSERLVRIGGKRRVEDWVGRY